MFGWTPKLGHNKIGLEVPGLSLLGEGIIRTERSGAFLEMDTDVKNISIGLAD